MPPFHQVENSFNYPPWAVVPATVAMAMQFVGWAEAVRNGLPNRFNGEPSGGRELSSSEEEVYDSALTVLLEFFASSELPATSKPANRRPEGPSSPPAKIHPYA